jgi:hypothetical protein
MMNTANTDLRINQSGARIKLSSMSRAFIDHDISPRYISLRARKVPKVKRPAFIWLKDIAKGGRGPGSYHEEFLNALFKSAGAIFVFSDGLSEDQEQSVVDAALSSGRVVAVFTMPRCAEAWTQAAGLGKKQ